VQALKKHPHNGTVYSVNDEWDCQYVFGSILAAYFSDIRLEEWSASVAGSSARCEFFLKPSGVMIELKYARKESDQSAFKGQIAKDLVDYGAREDVKFVLFLIYDPQRVLPNPVQLQKDLSGATKGLEDVKVIMSPPVLARCRSGLMTMSPTLKISM
jgi:hypothetical protein